jgi:hypothetical protein
MTKAIRIHWLDGALGDNIPREFARSFDDRDVRVKGVDPEQWAVLEQGPGHSKYWEVWGDVCDLAIITDGNDVTYHLWQNGDLWLIPTEMEWNDEIGDWVWPYDEEVK